jgi:sterol desaturase/sphingolipid hydroxylase (fatty acid hydroxylase superfamily)
MNPYIIIGIGLVLVLVIEKLFPRIKLVKKEGWMFRALTFNAIQLGIVLLGSYTWETYLDFPSLFKLPWSPFKNGLFAYVCATWVFYYWHYLRHENNGLWLVLHQFHHSPVRLEAITAFYKHPLEVFSNSIIMGVLTSPILGLDANTNAWLTIFLAIAEFFYHANIKTPYWLGFFIQRPESHLFHHMEDRQYTYNYGDLPIWDILNGTFWNPTDEDLEGVKTGFSNNREVLVWPMLKFKNVLEERPKHLPQDLLKCFFINLLFLLGVLSILGVIFSAPTLKGIGAASVASPLPFVFSAYQGVETFSTEFTIEGTFQNGTTSMIKVDHILYGKLKGPYNRRNVIGGVFSHGPFFVDSNMIKIRQQILHWGFCEGHLTKEFEIDGNLTKTIIHVRSKTKGNENKSWQMEINC